MTEEEKLVTGNEPDDKEEKGIAIDRREDGKVEPTTAVPASLWSYADTVPAEESLEALPDDFHKAKLVEDREGLDWRPKNLKVNHQAGTFDFSEMGVKDYSPTKVFCNVLAQAPNRALWKLSQDEEDKLPHCSSLDAIYGSLIIPETQEKVKCADCIFGKWWKPADLLKAAKDMPTRYGNLLLYINSKLDKDVTVASLAADEKQRDRNIPPPCKESRRLFLFGIDHTDKGLLNQPLILTIPPSSIATWDAYRDGLSQHKVKTSRGLIPITLITGVTEISLTTETFKGRAFSRFNFEYSNRVLPADFVRYCEALNQDWSPRVMRMEIVRDVFDVTTGVDPTTLSEDEKSSISAEDVQVGPAIDLDADIIG